MKAFTWTVAFATWTVAFAAWYGLYLIYPRAIAILTALAAITVLVAKTPEWFAPEQGDEIDELVEREL